MTTKAAGSADERVQRQSLWKKLFTRPEFGALSGAVLVWIFFAVVAGDDGFLTYRGAASYLEVSAQLGILTIAVTLLMIGGEFDLSVGSIIGATTMMTVILAIHYEWNLWLAMLASLVMALATGAINGLLVVRTKLPSFIITLGTLFIFRGLTIGLSREITGTTQVGGLRDLPEYEQVLQFFAYDIEFQGARFQLSIVWWLIFAAIATIILLRTSIGNWIYGIGGDENAARNVGVPVNAMKIGLFMTTAFAAWFVAQIELLATRSGNVLRGDGREFEVIIAAVIGGTLLTGGYGSAIGAVLGAFIFGMVKQGIFFTDVDSDYFRVFLGSMLILAVLINNFIRKRASEAK